MSFPRYPEYKDSGVEWLGDVPGHWEVKALKNVISRIESGVSVNAIDTPAAEGEIGVLKTSCVYRGWFDPAENKAVVPEEYGRVACPVTAGTLIVSRMNTPDLVGAAGMVRESHPGLFLPDRLWQVHFAAAHAAFIHYWTHSPLYRAQVQQVCAGASSSMQNLAQDQFRAFTLALPPVREQTAIAVFLDRETAKIDALVAEQKNLIALLKEKRQALISHAVTKGLDPDVPMKDSGVAWLGEVPAHWKVLPIRAVAQLESGHTPSRSRPDYWENCDTPWFTLADVWQIREGADYVFETKECVSALGLANSSARLLPAGTVILSRTASVGFSAIMGVPMATTQDFANWICGLKVLPRYLLHTLRAMRKEFERLKFGSTHNTIYMPDIAAFRFALPSIEEQEIICAFVDRELSQIDGLTTKAQSTIALLQERRTALISAAVTGKIDVRDLPAASAEPTPEPA
ncbi:Type I restriction-modification system, specificity subunit S [Thauera humireducens]|uniref:restriction endonuclease subunit S n=1 Tax=Thauera humireducens TaxID=1134435 RepID=UPI002467A079|nr:restriction endonuclease subunit S [Thauera humireducens]CAH1748287.1 Type I restriction-modification system, specificity subunit S [Thauera humireducens]